MKPFVLGIVGATGVVGQTLLDLLEYDTLPDLKVSELRLFASKASAGKTMLFKSKKILLEECQLERLLNCSAVIFAAESSISRMYIPSLVEKGVICIDKSSAFREEKDVPLVVPEVNRDAVTPEYLKNRPLIASPNCCAIPLTVALNPLLKTFGLKHVFVSTYQSVSGSGKNGMDSLIEETKQFFSSENLACQEGTVYPKSIAFNVLPFVSKIEENLGTEEENKIISETRKILNTPDLPIAAHSVRVPTLVGHAEAVTVELSRSSSCDELSKIFAQAPGVSLISSQNKNLNAETETDDEIKDFATPREIQGTDLVYISRLRQVDGFKNTFSMWIACDNLRKGAALNALQILTAIL